jgi:hypothetical protein
VQERDQEPVAPEEDPLLGLVREQVLVGDGELVSEDQRGLRRLERPARQGVRGLRELLLELRPQRAGRRPVPLGQLEALRVPELDPVDRRQRIPDDPRGLDRVTGQDLVEPGNDRRTGSGGFAAADR